MPTLAERLRAARIEKGWSKAELRRRSGVRSPSTLTELENGHVFETSQLPAIAEALGVEAVWLQTGKGPKYRSAGEPRGAFHEGPALPHIDQELLDALSTLSPEDRRYWRAQIIAEALRLQREQREQLPPKVQRAS